MYRPMYWHFRILCLTALIIFLSGGFFTAYSACSSPPGADATAEQIEAWAASCMPETEASGGKENSCLNRDPTTDEPTLTVWNFPATYNFEKLLREGTSMLCPVDDPLTEPDETDNYFSSGQIQVGYSPCNETPVLDSSDPSGYRCPGTSASMQSLSMSAGECETAHGIEFCAEETSNMICTFVPNGSSKMYIGCLNINPDIQPIDVTLSCFMPTVCTDDTASLSQNPIGFSISGTLVLCAEGAVEQLFFAGDGPVSRGLRSVAVDAFHSGDAPTYTTSDGTTTTIGNFYTDPDDPLNFPACGDTMFSKIQEAFSAAVIAALILWVILWGVRITLSEQLPQSGQFIKNIVVFAIVVYFTLGDGWQEYYPMLKQLMAGFSQLMMQGSLYTGEYGGLTAHPCYYTPDMYPPGMGTMALWDTLDCKIINYFFSGENYPKFFELCVGAIFENGSGFLFLLMGALFAFFLFIVLLFAVQIYIISFMAIALLLFISPIFIPMVLFSYTKGFFKTWLNELISVSLYPVVLFGFISVMLATFDIFYYGDASDNVFCTSSSCDTLFTSCDENSFGCQLDQAETGFTSVSNFDFDIALLQLLRVTFFAFLFYEFMLILPKFVAELTGSQKTDLAEAGLSPHQMKAMVLQKAQQGIGLGRKGVSLAGGLAKGGAKGVKGAASMARRK